MKLYLMQHGKSVPEETDPLRPLSSEGILETEKVIGHLPFLQKLASLMITGSYQFITPEAI